MLRRAITSCLFCALALLACAARAEACSCVERGSPCEAFGGASAAFIGTVTGIVEGARRQKPGGEVDFTPRLVKLSVEQAFSGVAGAEVEVATGLGDGDCGYPFAEGVSYVVYAYRGEKGGRLYTSACTRTRRTVGASEDLQYLRGLSFAPPGVAVSGKVQRAGAGADGAAPLEGALLSVEGAGRSEEVRTDAAGRFRLSGLIAGALKLRLHLPEGLAAYKPERLLKVEAGGCASEDFYVVDNGRVGGRVFDAQGDPLAGVRVVVLSTTAWGTGWPAKTDEEGRYKVSSLPPGQYLVGINVRGLPRSIEPAELPGDYVCPNCRVLVDMLQADELTGAYPRVFYPGVFRTSKAKLITLSAGQEVRDVDLRLPPRGAAAVVKGRVLRADGTPVAGAQVRYREVTYEDLKSLDYGVRANEQGEFSFKAYRGGRYVVTADYSPGRARHTGGIGLAAPLAVTVTRPEETITLIVARYIE